MENTKQRNISKSEIKDGMCIKRSPIHLKNLRKIRNMVDHSLQVITGNMIFYSLSKESSKKDSGI